MKNTAKISGFILLLFFIIFGGIYFKELNNLISKKRLYLIFDKQNDTFSDSTWSKYSAFFPDNFNPTIALVDSDEYSKLNEIERSKFDSISKAYPLSYPKKNIHKKNGREEFSISIGTGEAFEFEYENKIPIKISEIEKFETYNLTSITEMLRKDIMAQNIQVYIILVDSTRNKAYKMKAKTGLSLYD